MAIQMRRGAYVNFNPAKLMPGEWAVVVSGDSGAKDGKAAYICFAPGDVKRMATYEDIVNNLKNYFRDGTVGFSLGDDGHLKLEVD